MMNRQRKAFQLISLFLLVMLVFTGCGDKKQTPAAEENMDQTAQTALTAGVDYLRSQLELSTYSSDNDDLVYLLARAGLLTEADAAAYEEGLTAAIKSSWDLEKVTQWQKIAFAVAAAGGDPSDQAGMDFLSMVLSYDVTDENNEVDLYVLNSKLLAAGAFGDPMQDARIAADMVLAKQNADGAFEDQWGTTLDSTSMTLQALAASGLAEEEDVSAAVEKAVAYLSSQQGNDGSFLFSDTPSITSTAQACTALAAWGIDPASDQRFIKEGHSAWEALVTMYQQELEASEAEADFYARMQGAMGLAAGLRLHNGEGPYYTDGLFAVPAPEETPRLQKTDEGAKDAQPQAGAPAAASGETPQRAESAAEPQPETVTVAIKGDEETILAPVAVAWEEGDTAYSVLKRAAEAQDIAVEISGSGRKAYVEGIGDLYEFDKGATSGWLYEVNGTFPSKSAGGYTVAAGDSVIWHYTLDMGKDVGAAPGGQQ